MLGAGLDAQLERFARERQETGLKLSAGELAMAAKHEHGGKSLDTRPGDSTGV